MMVARELACWRGVSSYQQPSSLVQHRWLSLWPVRAARQPVMLDLLPTEVHDEQLMGDWLSVEPPWSPPILPVTPRLAVAGAFLIIGSELDGE